MVVYNIQLLLSRTTSRKTARAIAAADVLTLNVKDRNTFVQLSSSFIDRVLSFPEICVSPGKTRRNVLLHTFRWILQCII